MREASQVSFCTRILFMVTNCIEGQKESKSAKCWKVMKFPDLPWLSMLMAGLLMARSCEVVVLGSY